MGNVWDTTRTLPVGDVEMTVRVAGAGTPLVLLHGGTGSGADWDDVAAHLRDKAALYAPDSRGHGATRGPSARLSYAAMADDVAGLVAALGLDAPVVAGWSDGGNIALELGIRHPGLARALVVGGAWIRLDEHMQHVNRDVLGMTAPGVVDRSRLERNGMLARLLEPGDRREEDVLPLLEALSDAYLADPQLDAGRLARIEVPTLVVLGDRDPLVPLEHGVDLYRMLPQGSLAVLPGAAHDLPHPDHAADFARLIASLLD